jgi:serine/threonine protein kinase
MTPTNGRSRSAPPDADAALADWAASLADRLQRGESLDVSVLLREHPERADELRRLLPAIALMAEFGDSEAGAGTIDNAGDALDSVRGILGDFRLIREIGRGGMGVVYEAEQLSLRRRVALKVLPFASALDARQLQRFQLEAHAAACLHHTHIVPIHAVGCDRGTHFYAMQFIEGRTLAQLIAELRRLDGHDAHERPTSILADVATTTLARRLLTGRLDDADDTPAVTSYVRAGEAPGGLPASGADGRDGGPYVRATAQPTASSPPDVTTALPLPSGEARSSLPLPPGEGRGEGSPPPGEAPDSNFLPRGERATHSPADPQTTHGHDLDSPSPVLGEGRGEGSRQRTTPRSTSATHTRAYVESAARLALQAAEALDHAHARGILHRDIKPANLILGGDGHLWVTDFGLAQIQGDNGLTLTGDVLGTLRYMSPEQAAGRRVVIDGRTDVYSLGVTLYELLALRPAFDGPDRAALLHQVLHDDPPPLRALNPAVPRDLETIVQKATTKEPLERYSTARDLADDLQRLLLHHPIEARRPTPMDRAAKWARRHRAWVAAAALIALALVAATAISLWQSFRATDAVRRAVAENKAARAELAKFHMIYQFLTEDLLTQAEPEKNAVEDHVTLLEVLDRAAEKVGARYKDQPELEIELRQVIARTYSSLASYAKAERHWAAIGERTGAAFGPNDRRTVAAEIERSAALQQLGRLAEAIPRLEQALEKSRDLFGPEDPETLAAMNVLGNAYREAGLYDQALPLLEALLAAKRTTRGPDHAETLTASMNLAVAYQAAGQLERALPMLAETLQRRRSSAGIDHLETLRTMSNLAAACQDAGQLGEAIALLEEALTGFTHRLGPDNAQTLVCVNNLATAYTASGRLDKAIPMLEEVLARKRMCLEAGHPSLLAGVNNLAVAYRDAGWADKALPLVEEALAALRARRGSDHPETLLCMNNLAVAYQELDRFDRAIELLQEVVQGMGRRLPAGHPQFFLGLNNLAMAYWDAGRLEEAMPLLERAWAGLRAELGSDHNQTLSIANRLAAAYLESGRVGDALQILESAVPLAVARLGPDDAVTITLKTVLAQCLQRLGRLDEAIALYRECLAAREQITPDAWSRYNVMSLLGGALLARREFSEAEQLLEAGYEGLTVRAPTIAARAKHNLHDAGWRVVRLYEAWGKPDEATRWRARLDGEALDGSMPNGPDAFAPAMPIDRTGAGMTDPAKS